MAKLQQPLLLNLPQEDFGEMEPAEPSSPNRFLSRLRGLAPVADTSSAGSPPASPARMNMRTFLQGLTTERGPLSSALLDFATSAREEELLSSSAFRSPVGEFLHDRGQEVHEVHFEESDVEKGLDSMDQDIEPGLTASSPSAGGTCGAGALQAPEMESQETDYTMHVADSCASTEGSSIVQDSRPPTKQSPRTSDEHPRHCLNIIDESKEWGEMSSSLDDDSYRGSRDGVQVEKGGRSPRAAQIEVNSGASIHHIDPNLVRCGNWCLFFLEMWISTGCILLCAFRKDWCLCFLLALPHTLLVGIEVQLIGRDWAFRRNLHALQKSSRGKAMFFKSIVFLIFGCLSCLPVMRARQCWKQRGMRASLVDEIETPAGEGLHESARFDSHVMFVTNVPRIIVLLYASTSLVYTELELSVLLSMAFLSLLNVLQAAVNFDYYASKWIRAQYETLTSEGFPFQFQVLHYSYRLCEIALRILTLLLVTGAALRFHVWVAVLYLCLDYLLSTAALCFVTAKQAPGSRLVLILSVSIYVFDCCRFIDEQGLTRQARQVSKLLRKLRSGQSVLVLPLLWWIHPEGSSVTLTNVVPTALLLHLLALVWLLEKCTRLQHQAVDIFMACKKGLLQEVLELLDSGCDCNLRLVDDGSTPLHVAAGCGQSDCVEVLLRRGADPLLSDVDGETPLHKACRHGHARCIRVLLHPPVDAPCVLRGDFLECAAQVNQLGQRPLQLLEAVEKSCNLVDELAEFQHQPDLKRSLSSQMSQLSSPTRSLSGELHGAAQSVFGEVLKNSESRFLVASKHVGTSRSLTGFLFTTGIGEQMAEVLDNYSTPAESPQLTTLRTQGVLGAGAFGKVFKVLDVCSSEVYALKLQRRDSTTKFAIREAEALHRSSHAFIVRLIHIFQTQSYYALLMELCDKSLNACILDSLDENDQIGGLADAVTKRYAACITLALEYLHQQRVVFRDLKPDNVLVTFKDNVAKLADFGLARSLTLESAVEARGSEESGSDKLSPKVSSTVCGTPRFMAPEVYDELMLVDSDDEEDAIKRLLSRDWYALGCCLLLMLLGQEAGSLAEANGRRVLLPPSGQAEITCSLRKASKKGRIDEDALHLIDSLTAPVEVRFDASDLRQQPFLKQVIVEMEEFASA